VAEEAEIEEDSMTYIGRFVREIVVEPEQIPVAVPEEPAAVPVPTKGDEGEVLVPA
jgi:hypothetical protein